MNACPGPAFWAPQPVPSPRGDGAVACGDTPAPLFDVATLSAGLPDGVYFAGRQVQPWLTRDELLELSDLRIDRMGRISDERAARLLELRRRLMDQSLVVRWEVQGGRPSAPEALRNPYRGGSDGDERAFTWSSGIVFDADLAHVLLADVLRGRRHDAPDSSNHYYDRVAPALKSLATTWAIGETWVLPRRVIERVVAEQDLLEARERLAEADAAARAAGADVGATASALTETGEALAVPQSMLFGVDFDGTFSRDPELFRGIVAQLRARGHQAVLVTGRSDEGRWGAEVRSVVGDLMPIVFAADGWKREAARAAGYRVDVWMDDHPEYVAFQDPRRIVNRLAREPVAGCDGGDSSPNEPPACAACRDTLTTTEHALACEDDRCEDPGQRCVARRESCRCTHPADIAAGVRAACACCGAVSAASTAPASLSLLLLTESWVHFDSLVWLCPVCGDEPEGLCFMAPWADADDAECPFGGSDDA